MKIKVADLNGPALNAMVAKANGADLPALLQLSARVPGSAPGQFLIDYLTDWAQGGPLIEREMDSGLHLSKRHNTFVALYAYSVLGTEYYGSTPLIAAMRCYVAKQLGNAVEVPDELCGYHPTYLPMDGP